MNKIIWKTYTSISSLDQQEWDELQRNDFPFQKWSFYLALEKSQSIGSETGWDPQYFCAYEDDKLIAAIVGFVKTHSYGEYIFDWEFAHIYQQYNLNYYPKMLFAIPFSPVVGPKFLLHGQANLTDIVDSFQKFFKFDEKYSGVHFLFTTDDENKSLQKHYSHRTTFQYHWKNHNYENFDHFLQGLKKNRRKSISKERKTIQNYDLDIKIKESSFSQVDIELLWQFYVSTINKKMSHAYLNRSFFEQIFTHMPENIILVQAYKDEQLIAQSFFLKEGKKLFGRYWGILPQLEENYPFLHFELCYYQGIEYCLRNGLSHFEAGAQGEHKLLRGFDPVITHSFHQFFHPHFHQAFSQFFDKEKLHLEQQLKQPERFSAYKTKV